MFRRSVLHWCAATAGMTLPQAMAMLQIRSVDSASDLKSSFLRQAMQWHPDVNAAPEATKQFQLLNEALNICMTARSRGIRGIDAMRPSAATGDDISITELLNDLHQRAGEILDRAALHAPVSAIAQQAISAKTSSAPRSLERVATACDVLRSTANRTQFIVDALPASLCGSRAFHCLVDPAADAFAALRAITLLETLVPRLVARLVRELPKQLLQCGVTEDWSTFASFRPLVLVGCLSVTVAAEGDDASAVHGTIPSWLKATSDNAAVTAIDATTEDLHCLLSLPSRAVSKHHHTTILNALEPAMRHWQLASIRRVVAERRASAAVLAISRLCRLAPLGTSGSVPFGTGGGSVNLPLQLMPNLSWSNTQAEMLSTVLEKLSAEGHAKALATPEMSFDLSAQLRQGGRPARSSSGDTFAGWVDDDSAETSRVFNPKLDVTRCIAALRLEPTLEDLRPPSTKSSADATPKDSCRRFMVARAPTACRAEDVRYDVFLRLSTRWVDFHAALINALATVGTRAARALEVLPTVIQLRDEVEGTSDEQSFHDLWLRHQQHAAADGAVASRATTIKCFPRVYGLDTKDEEHFWTCIARHRTALASQQAVVGTINVRGLHDSPDDNVSADAFGWIGRDREGSDEVTIAPHVLQDDALFNAWLEDVMIHACLSKQAESLVHTLGMSDVTRHPALPLYEYLGFLNRFKGSAARSVLQARTNGGIPVSLHVVPETHTLTVSRQGDFIVPWNIDPASILTVFADQSSLPQLPLC